MICYVTRRPTTSSKVTGLFLSCSSLYIRLFISCVGMCLKACVCEGHRTVYKSWVSPTVWVCGFWGIILRSSGLAVSYITIPQPGPSQNLSTCQTLAKRHMSASKGLIGFCKDFVHLVEFGICWLVMCHIDAS